MLLFLTVAAAVPASAAAYSCTINDPILVHFPVAEEMTCWK